VLDLEVFCELAAETALAWRERGATALVTRSPDDGRNKSSAWLTIDTGSIAGSLTIWESGEGELEADRLDADEDRSPLLLRHVDDISDRDIPELLAVLDAALRTRP
jgi:hypothetical protein